MNIPAILLVTALLLLPTSRAYAQSSGKYSVGQRVMADATGIGNFKAGVVTEVLPFDRYRVQLDDEVDRYEPTVMLARNMRAGASASPVTPSTNGTASGASNQTGTGTTGTGNGGGGAFSVGQRVMADGTGIGLFKSGVITEVLPFDRFRVQFDEEIGKYEPTVILKKNMKAGGSVNPTNQMPIAANPQVTLPVHTAPTPTPVAQHHPAPVTQPTDEHAGADDSPEWHKQGKGAPPSGIYVCESDSPGYAAAGDKLEIRGNTYRGIGQNGGFHPYTLGALNRINWSAGLMSIPDGWPIKHSYYYGLDYMGRPLIKIYYRSTSGWNHCIDCFMGK